MQWRSEGTYIGVLRSELEASKSVQGDASLSKLLADSEAVSVVENKDQVLALVAAIDAGELPSHGGVSMWNGSKVQNWKVLRVVFKKETWLSVPFQLTLAGSVAAGIGAWGWRLASQVSALSSGESPGWGVGGSVLFGVEALAFCGVSFGVYKAAGFISFVLSRYADRLRARAHAPFRGGPGGLQCMKGAVAASQTQTRELGYGMWILNVDADHPDSEALPNAGFRTDFLQKWLSDPPPSVVVDSASGGGAGETDQLKGDSAEGVTWAMMAPRAFCDPRDV